MQLIFVAQSEQPNTLSISIPTHCLFQYTGTFEGQKPHTEPCDCGKGIANKKSKMKKMGSGLHAKNLFFLLLKSNLLRNSHASTTNTKREKTAKRSKICNTPWNSAHDSFSETIESARHAAYAKR